MRIGTRFPIEAIGMAAFSLLAVFTAFNHRWIELVFGVDPDSGSGLLEWTLLALAALVTAAGAAVAYNRWSTARVALAGDKNV